MNVPKSFALETFNQTSHTVGLFSHNKSLSNTVDTLDSCDYDDGYLIANLGTSLDSSGDILLNQNDILLTFEYDSETYSGTIDTSSNISFHRTSDTHSDASGYFSATLYDVTHGGKFIVFSNSFTLGGSSSNISYDDSSLVVTIPLESTSPTMTRTHAVSISSYISYVDTSGNIA